MDKLGTIGVSLVMANVILTFIGLTNRFYFEKLKFKIRPILMYNDVKRILLSGFLHTNWRHLAWNVFGMIIFIGLLKSQIGGMDLLIIYFSSMLGANVLALYVYRKYGDYSAVGATGAVYALIFSSVALAPGLELEILIMPISVPTWFFGLIFVFVSIYLIRSMRDNIGHELHVAAGLIGVIVAIYLRPHVLSENFKPIIKVLLGGFALMYFISTQPKIIFVHNYFFKKKELYRKMGEKYKAIKDYINFEEPIKQKIKQERPDSDINRILDKIYAQGIESLTQEEKDILDQFSK
jgi:membrane associated rhomboid family serine protease